jgi:hypothetical protein
VHRRRRPTPRALPSAHLGGGALATTILAALATVGAPFGVTWKIASLALSTALNFGPFWVGFFVLTAREVSWR